MKNLIMILIFMVSPMTQASATLPSYMDDSVLPAYEIAYQQVSGVLGGSDFRVDYQFRVSYEDDPIIMFSFLGDSQDCFVQVRMYSHVIEESYCRH